MFSLSTFFPHTFCGFFICFTRTKRQNFHIEFDHISCSIRYILIIFTALFSTNERKGEREWECKAFISKLSIRWKCPTFRSVHLLYGIILINLFSKIVSFGCGVMKIPFIECLTWNEIADNKKCLSFKTNSVVNHKVQFTLYIYCKSVTMFIVACLL